ncbi:Uncharacterised protein [Burkholderia pseudomallei]|nr:Uncharacterised protein [Burkholderia pseudomallei]
MGGTPGPERRRATGLPVRGAPAGCFGAATRAPGCGAFARASWPSCGAVPASAAGRHTWPIASDCSFLRPPYQRFTRPREKNTAENIDVRMPRQCTIANARTGPEPKASSARPAISVVTFESRIVAHACA